MQAGPFTPATSGLDFALHGGAIRIGTNPNTGQEIVWMVMRQSSALHALDARTGSFLFGGAAITALLDNAQAIVTDTLGNVWVANGTARARPDGSSMTAVIEFSPGAANDYSLATEFEIVTPVGVEPPTFEWITLDGASPANIWLSDPDGQIVELSGRTPGVQDNVRTFVSPGMNSPGPIAVDANGNIWAANVSQGASEIVNAAGGLTERDLTANTILSPGGIAIDGAGTAWVSNTDANADKEVVTLAPDGTSPSALTAAGGYTGGSPGSGGPLGFVTVDTRPLGIAIDASGNVWIAQSSGSVVELVGAAGPVKTPNHGPAVKP